MSLKELLDEELYNQVIKKAGDNKIAIVSDGNWFPKDKFDQVNNDNKELKQQLKSRDTQLDELKTKATGNEDLQKQIQTLQDQNGQIKEEYESKIQKQTFDYALKDALTVAKVRNPKAAKALLNTEAIKLDGDKLLGLEEQLKTIKESDPYLFEEVKSEPGKPNFTTGKHQTVPTGEPSNLTEALAQHYTQK